MEPIQRVHGDWLRALLREERERLKLSLEAVARRIGKLLGRARFTKQQLSTWENPPPGRKTGPRMEEFAAWAEALDLELIVTLARREDGVVPVHVTPEIAEIARGVTLLSKKKREAIAFTVDGFLGRDP